MSPDKPYKVLLVTSAAPSEGKTTVASCIAIAMAQAGQRVVLVDCDLRRPRLHKVFRKTNAVGVSSALIEQVHVDDIVQETGIPNLKMIPSGPCPPNPAELLHSDRFKELLAQIASKFDRVILDSPPIVPVTDAAVLSTLVDGTVMVVRAFKTTQDLARHAMRMLGDVGSKKVGAVLNAVNFSRHEYKYSYYYYRRDGYYAAQPGEDSKTRPAAAREEEAARLPPHESH